MFDDAPRSASVATLEPCRLMSLQKSLVQEVVHADPEIALHLQEGLARRVRKLTESVRTLALLDVFGRLARTLDGLAVERDGAARHGAAPHPAGHREPHRRLA
jgi:CRP/FNR family cyclic AMP-dependent transcriptional regulator